METPHQSPSIDREETKENRIKKRCSPPERTAEFKADFKIQPAFVSWFTANTATRVKTPPQLFLIRFNGA